MVCELRTFRCRSWESEKVGLKLNIQKTKIMASSLITSWQIEGEKVEPVTDFIFLGSKISADGGCGHEIKRHLLLGRKVMTSLNSVLKSRDITFLTKVHIVKAMVFPAVMYGYDQFSSVQLLSCVQLCDPMNRSTPGLPVLHQLPELAQTHIHRVGNAIQPSHPLSSPSPPSFNLSQHQGHF